jgi:hypothetical protein
MGKCAGAWKGKGVSGMPENGTEEWVEVFFTYDSVECEIMKDLLESGGIPVRVVSFRVGPYPVNVAKMGEMKLLVMRKDAEAAERAIEDFSGGGPQ